jgi:hypothetical protein
MAGKGMGIATRGGGAVISGARNKKVSSTESTTGIPMYKKGGAVNKMTKGGAVNKMTKGGAVNKMTKGGAVKKMMEGGMMTKGAPVKKMMGGGMMKKGYAKGGAIKKKMK